MTDHSQLVKTLRIRGGKMNLASADAIDALQADAERSETHRNDLYDKIVSQRTVMNALTNERNAAERERDALQARVAELEAERIQIAANCEAIRQEIATVRRFLERNPS